jgi:hypothetical protein
MDVGDCGVAAWHAEPVPDRGPKSRKYRETIRGAPHELLIAVWAGVQQAGHVGSWSRRPLNPNVIGPICLDGASQACLLRCGVVENSGSQRCALDMR